MSGPVPVNEASDDVARQWFIDHGWEARQESWYDEEGVDAWRWEHADHAEEFAEMGAWDEEPPVTDEMVAFMEAHRD